MPPREWCEAKTQFANMFDEGSHGQPRPRTQIPDTPRAYVAHNRSHFKVTRTMTICAILHSYSRILVTA